MPRRHLCSLSLALLVGIAAVRPGGAAEPPPAGTISDQTAVTVVSVRVDVRDGSGRVPADLVPADLELREEGEVRPIVGLVAAVAGGPVAAVGVADEEPSGSTATAVGDGGTVRLGAPLEDPWQIAIYFDLPLCGVSAVAKAARALAAEAEHLAALGQVEVVVADPKPEVLLAASRDPGKIREVLEKVAKKRRGGEQVAALRREYLRAFDEPDAGHLAPPKRTINPPTPGGGGAPGRPGGSGITVVVDPLAGRGGSGHDDTARPYRQRAALRTAVQQEVALLTRQRALLNDWLAMVDRGGTRQLLLVADGWDVDPREFYLGASLDDGLRDQVAAELLPLAGVGSTEQLAATLAGAGWRADVLAFGNLGAALQTASSASASGRALGFRDSRVATRGGASSFLLAAPEVPLREVADTTGGELVRHADALPAAVERLGEGFVLSYQVSRPPDGKARRIEVLARRPGLVVRAPEVAGAAPPDALLAARARHLLGAENETAGELVVAAQFALDAAAPAGTLGGSFEARVDLAALAPLRETLTTAALRVTVALALPDGRVSITQQVFSSLDLSRLADWRYKAPLRAPAGTERLAVVVDELTTGSWGAVRIDLVAPVPRRRRSRLEETEPDRLSAGGGSDLAPVTSPGR